jgi:hypothetical protein
MFFLYLRSTVRSLVLFVLGAATFIPLLLSSPVVASAPPVQPLISDWQFLSSGATPPSQAACNAVGRRCFNPAAMHNAYNYASLLALGHEGQRYYPQRPGRF